MVEQDRIPGIQSRIRIESYSFEQQDMNKWKQKNRMRTKVEQRWTESQTMNKLSEQQ